MNDMPRNRDHDVAYDVEHGDLDDDARFVGDLVDLTTPIPVELGALHERLEDAAEAAGLVDVAYRTIDSPVGALLLAATERGLVRVAYEREGFEDVLELLATRVSPRVLHAPKRLDEPATQLEEYFEGRLREFDVPLDFSLSHGFREVVQRHLPDIPYGRTESYREVAVDIGHPRAVRAVGTACAQNPLPVVVPCHRVIRSDGSLGQYAGGPEAKQTLLTMEGSVA